MTNKVSGEKKFILIIPIIIIVMTIVYDNVLLMVNEKRFKKDSEEIVYTVMENKYEDKEKMIRMFYEEKNYQADDLTVEERFDHLYVYNTYVYPAFLGKIFGTNQYRTEIYLDAYIDKNNNKIIIKEDKQRY